MTTREMQEGPAEVPLAKIKRDNYRELEQRLVDELKASIEVNGQLSPVAVVRVGDLFELVYGEHRYEAMRRLGRPTILALVFDSLTVVDRLALRLQENLLRTDNDPIETALECERLRVEMGGTSKDVARKVGISEGYLCKLLKRLKADERLIALAREKKIPGRAVDALLSVKGEEKRESIIAAAVEQKLSAERVEQLCREARDPKSAARKLAVKLPGGMAVSVVIPSSAKVADVVSAFDGMTKEIRRCAGQRPDLRDFLAQLSLNLSAAGGK